MGSTIEIIILITLKMLSKKIRGQFPDQSQERKEEIGRGE